MEGFHVEKWREAPSPILPAGTGGTVNSLEVGTRSLRAGEGRHDARPCAPHWACLQTQCRSPSILSDTL